MNRRLILYLIVAILLLNVAWTVDPPPTRADDTAQLADQPPSQYKLRRQRLMEKTSDGIVVVLGNISDETLGVDAKFRQNDDFMYLTGVSAPDSFLLLVPDGYQGAKEWLFLPTRSTFQNRWEGPQPEPGPQSERLFGSERVVATQQFHTMLFEILNSEARKKSGITLYTIIPTGNKPHLTQQHEFIENVRKSAPHVRIQPLGPLTAELRVIKSRSELTLIQRAIDITVNAQLDVLNNVKPTMFEYELEGIILGRFYSSGAQRAAFPCIVGSGVNSTILHYNNNRKKIEEGDLIVVDIGAEYSYYAADITRTYPANGKFTARQKEIYKLVLEAQTAAVKAFKPGRSTIYDLHEAAEQTMRSSRLRDSQARTLDISFVHGLGHFLGMYVHDVGDYNRPLQPGMVITIEPGIYLSDEKIGVRIEDDYLVTETSLVKLSQHCPSDPDEIERLMANRNLTK
ncbi:MAG: aminopeptidase P family protein [Acidobacteriota bacterium]